MKVTEYDAFVRRTDQNANRPQDDRQNIALYGLVGEIGSLMSAIKKQLLSSSGVSRKNIPTDDIVEELGDIIWYCFALTHVYFPNKNVNILNNEIAFIRRMIVSNNSKYSEFRDLLPPTRPLAFLKHMKNTQTPQN